MYVRDMSWNNDRSSISRISNSSNIRSSNNSSRISNNSISISSSNNNISRIITRDSQQRQQKQQQQQQQNSSSSSHRNCRSINNNSNLLAECGNPATFDRHHTDSTDFDTGLTLLSSLVLDPLGGGTRIGNDLPLILPGGGLQSSHLLIEVVACIDTIADFLVIILCFVIEC